MFQMLKKRIKNEKGLTLVELLAVIVILGIISAIAIPAIGNIIDNSRIKAAKSDALNILNAANIYLAENGEVTKIEYAPATTGATPAAAAFTVTGKTGATYPDFGESIESLGNFSEVAFTIANTAAGGITIDGTVTPSSGITVDFDTAKASEIDAGDADSDTTKVVVEKK